MSKKIKFAVRAVLAGAALSVASTGAYAAGAVQTPIGNWALNDNVVGANDSISTKSLSGGISASRSWTDNSALNNSAWGHAVQWFTFQVTAASQIVTIRDQVLTGTSNRAFTVWASNGAFDGGTATEETRDGNTFSNAPHSFNAVGQLGDPGTLWASDPSVPKSQPLVDPSVTVGVGNLLKTLAYVNAGNAHTDPALNDWNEVIHSGVNQVDTSGAYFTAVNGNYSANVAELVFKNLKAGWYAVATGGANSALSEAGLTHQLTVSTSAVPLPGAVYLFGSVLAGLVASTRRKRQLA
ncbi:MAG: hypothetical protein ACXV7F_01250 [Methylomonas sp.]